MGEWDDWEDDPQPEETDLLSDFVAIHAAKTPEELWRVLTLPGTRSGLHPFEAVGLFRHLHEQGGPDALKTALMLCTCGRWEPYTGRLIAGLVGTATLSEQDLDELVARFLWSDRYRFTYPVKWFGAQELVIDLDEHGQAGKSIVISLDPDAPVPVDRRIAPPLRRWAAATAVCRDPLLFDRIKARAHSLGGRDGAAITMGVLDAIASLETGTARRAIAFGLDWPLGSVRLHALDLLAAIDPEAARRRAATDPDKKVRAWTGPRPRRVNASVAENTARGTSGKRDGALGPGQAELFPDG